MLKKEFEFILNDEIKYSQDGQFVVAKKLLLRAPSVRVLNLANRLSSTVMSALFKARETFKEDAKTSKSSAPQEMDGESIYMLISSSIDDFQKMDNLIDTFKELLLSQDVCLVDGKISLNQFVFESMDSREALRLMGEYIASFLLPSILEQSKKKK